MEEVALNPTTGLPEFTQDWGRRLLEGTNRTWCTPGSKRKEQWANKRLTQTCPRSRNLRQRCGSVVACCRIGGMDYSSVCLRPSEGGRHYLHYLHLSLAWSNNREETHLCPSRENWIKALLSMALPIRTRPSFPLSQSLLSRSFHKPLILLHKRAGILKTTITEN